MMVYYALDNKYFLIRGSLPQADKGSAWCLYKWGGQARTQGNADLHKKSCQLWQQQQLQLQLSLLSPTPPTPDANTKRCTDPQCAFLTVHPETMKVMHPELKVLD